MIQTIAASPIQGTFAPSATVTASATLTFSEPGTARLADLIVQATVDDVTTTTASIEDADLSPALRIQAITLNGSTLFLRGRNTASPGNCFLSGRAANFINLPDVKVNSGDTLVVTAIYNRTDIAANLSIMVPFNPERFAGMRDAGVMGQPGQWEIYAGSPITAITADGAADAAVTVTFDTPGLIDLSRVVISAVAESGSAAAGGDYTPASANNVPLQVQQLILRSDYNIVTGQGTPSAPSPFQLTRQKNFLNLGIHRVVPGDTLVAQVRSYCLAALNGSVYMGVPQLPDAGFGFNTNQCIPCR